MTSRDNSQPGPIVAVIPARFHSTRLPGKVLAPLAGRPLILHVLENATKAQHIDRVLVATDDARVVEVVEGAGGEAVLTDSQHASGSDRIGEAVSGIEASIVVNMQGDEPLLGPMFIDALVEALLSRPWASASTLATELDPNSADDPNIVKVAMTASGRALYFSRATIPSVHPSRERKSPLLRHIGMYGFRREAFDRFLAEPVSALEEQEGLEQLRVLEMGLTMAVGIVDGVGPGVDTEADLARCEAILARGGNAV